jgi:hypothetical protein
VTRWQLKNTPKCLEIAKTQLISSDSVVGFNLNEPTSYFKASAGQGNALAQNDSRNMLCCEYSQTATDTDRRINKHAHSGKMG